jgi:HSP90 family molecular chaperone
LRNLNAVLTKRVLRWLADEAKKDAKAYSDFYGNWGLCLKEGVAMDRFNAPVCRPKEPCMPTERAL